MDYSWLTELDHQVYPILSSYSPPTTEFYNYQSYINPLPESWIDPYVQNEWLVERQVDEISEKSTTEQFFPEHIHSDQITKCIETEPILYGKSKCPDCSLMFSNEGSLTRHVQSQHPSSKVLLWKCDDCGRRFTKKRSRNKHMQAKHPDSKLFRLKCIETRCRKRFSTESGRKRHMQQGKHLILS